MMVDIAVIRLAADIRSHNFLNLLPGISHTLSRSLNRVRHNLPPPSASWQHLRIYSSGGTCSGMLAI